jgi:hypothetical protein
MWRNIHSKCLESGFILWDQCHNDYNGPVQNLNLSMKTAPAAVAEPSLQMRIIRAVASSTAIETGQSIQDLEALLKAQTSKFQQLALAVA